VHQASSGQQALWAIVAGTRFDLVITDQVMANMKGAELIRRVRQLQPDLPALIITGFPDTIESLTDIQGVGALIKPFQRSELIETVSRLIARGRNPSATPTNPGHHPNGALERHIT
jgi:DNA-binding NtrC family response regulator